MSFSVRQEVLHGSLLHHEFKIQREPERKPANTTAGCKGRFPSLLLAPSPPAGRRRTAATVRPALGSLLFCEKEKKELKCSGTKDMHCPAIQTLQHQMKGKQAGSNTTCLFLLTSQSSCAVLIAVCLTAGDYYLAQKNPEAVFEVQG